MNNEARSSTAIFSDTIHLVNSGCTAGISPRVGRVVEFFRARGANILWRTSDPVAAEDLIGPYTNWGGDKIWPAMQMMWPRYSRGQWPPDGTIDGKPWTVVERSERRLVIESAVNAELRVRARRTFELDAQSPRLQIDSVLTRVERSPLPVCIWSVTQVKRPDIALLDVAPDRAEASDWRHINLSDDGHPLSPPVVQNVAAHRAIAYRPATNPPGKIGGFGRWLAGVYPEGIFLQQTAFEPTGAYPDRSNIQVFACERYVEIETLSPQVQLQPGESLRHGVVWKLLDLPGGDIGAIVQACENA